MIFAWIKKNIHNYIIKKYIKKTCRNAVKSLNNNGYYVENAKIKINKEIQQIVVAFDECVQDLPDTPVNWKITRQHGRLQLIYFAWSKENTLEDLYTAVICLYIWGEYLPEVNSELFWTKLKKNIEKYW